MVGKKDKKDMNKEINKINQLKSDSIQFNYIKYKFNRIDILLENEKRYLLKLELNNNDYSYNVCGWFDKKFTTTFEFGLYAILAFPESFKVSVFREDKFKEGKIDWKAPLDDINLYEYVKSGNIVNLLIINTK